MFLTISIIYNFHVQVPIILHNESEQARAWSQIHSEDTKKQCIPVITAWQLNERMWVITDKAIFDTTSPFVYIIWFVIYDFLSVGMENYRALISKKQQIDTEKNKFMNGDAVLIYPHQMVRVWKCVLREPLPTSKNT